MKLRIKAETLIRHGRDRHDLRERWDEGQVRSRLWWMVGHSDPRRLGLSRELVSCCCFQSWKKKSSAGGCSRVNQWRHHHQSFVPARHFVSVLFLLQGISLCAAPKQRNRPKVTASSSTHDTTLVSVCHAFPFWRHSLLLRLLFFFHLF